MRRSTTQPEIPLPITYTPTTHRISKAKKGKRVHACEYPGCNKVFTRAEHRRRHELNHNPEALFRCAHQNCKKAFHRPDLLARHMERHELEAQMDTTAQWQRQNRASVMSETYVPKCTPVDTHPTPYLTVTQPQNAMSVGSLVGPAIHPDFSSDCGLMWNGVDLHSAPHTPLYQGPQIHESIEDSRFYATPDTCPSPASDGSLSLHSYSRSSVVSTPVTTVEPYPESIIEHDLTSSPLSMQSRMGCWEQQDISLPSMNMMPIPLTEGLLQPSLHCAYPSPSWSTQILHYDENALPPAAFPPTMGWKSWTM
ncbi:C2H2 finger domain protein [Aspergillus homomorphus CBS 101889]|uniref:C2H2 finger domain protein n=1 Tax=Aspergillus homomorphus (strain CBS 101889) TaxID=1450537 RepID=A0A395HPA3_ASPHC|nr:C2H2 finger domain protein [Aspergillus homomorphus CBS 101889]RAL08094.1 C2H2 finger domain protein [Aspergillus homomorphus CBS 101889]